MRPLSCPICGKTPVEAVLDQVAIHAIVNKQNTQVGGLKAFQCWGEGHIFFVRETDLQSITASTGESNGLNLLKPESRSR